MISKSSKLVAMSFKKAKSIIDYQVIGSQILLPREAK